MFSPAKLKHFRIVQNLTQQFLAQEVGVSKPAYHMWESGKTVPNQKNLEKLCHILRKVPQDFEEHSEILKVFTQLDTQNKTKVLDYSQSLLDEQISNKEQLIAYHVYEKLAAGTGNTIYGEQESDIVYFNKELAHDFASWVSGDSMEPKYQNGSVALIKETGFDYDGAVYAVVWNGKTFIKKVYRENDGLRMVSLNPDYKDFIIPYEDEPRIVGIIVGHFIPLEV